MITWETWSMNEAGIKAVEKILVAGKIQNDTRTLVLGIGNNGRSDDGLGWAFLDELEASGIFNGKMEYRYQLGIEDAELISHFDQVVIVDAYADSLERGAAWQPCKPEDNFSFTTHEVPPGVILHLCHDLYGKTPQVDCLLIAGKDWGLKIGLSEDACQNLDRAFGLFKERLVYQLNE